MVSFGYCVSRFCLCDTVIVSNDAIGTAVYYVFYIIWYFGCFNLAALFYGEIADQPAVRQLCLLGIHTELTHTFTLNYDDVVIPWNLASEIITLLFDISGTLLIHFQTDFRQKWRFHSSCRLKITFCSLSPIRRPQLDRTPHGGVLDFASSLFQRILISNVSIILSWRCGFDLKNQHLGSKTGGLTAILFSLAESCKWVWTFVPVF